MTNGQVPRPTEEDVREGWIISLGSYPDSSWLDEKHEFEQLRDSPRVRSHFILSGFTWAVLDDERIAGEVALALARVWDAYVAEGILSRDRLEDVLDNMNFWHLFGRDAARPRRVRCYFGQTDPTIPSDITTHAGDHVVVRYVD